MTNFFVSSETFAIKYLIYYFILVKPDTIVTTVDLIVASNTNRAIRLWVIRFEVIPLRASILMN